MAEQIPNLRNASVSKEEQSYFVTTPYVDAYQHNWEPDTPKLGLPDFVAVMRSQAGKWGEMGLGRAIVLGHEVPTYDSRPVLAIGIFGAGDKYVAVQREPGKHAAEVVAADWPAEWDVT